MLVVDMRDLESEKQSASGVGGLGGPSTVNTSRTLSGRYANMTLHYVTPKPLSAKHFTEVT